MLSNGTGGIDWAGLPIVAALLGVADLEAFTRHLITIKNYRPDKTDSAERPEEKDNGSSNTLC